MLVLLSQHRICHARPSLAPPLSALLFPLFFCQKNSGRENKKKTRPSLVPPLSSVQILCGSAWGPEFFCCVWAHRPGLSPLCANIIILFCVFDRYRLPIYRSLLPV